ncbi:MAG: hypothetical protein KBT48_05550 [Firmicutes bacterium]|nr:hypothetical protein [Bacillota bacterium]
MEGGSGRASIASPTTLVIEDEKKEVQIVWSSPYYDYMIVNGEKYENEATEGNSTFTIPVQDLDQALHVIADTTAMSVPHEIEYTLTFKIVE